MDRLLTPEFWQMGGYAVYLWPCYIATVAVFAWNLVAPRLRRRALLRGIRENAP